MASGPIPSRAESRFLSFRAAGFLLGGVPRSGVLTSFPFGVLYFPVRLAQVRVTRRDHGADHTAVPIDKADADHVRSRRGQSQRSLQLFNPPMNPHLLSDRNQAGAMAPL